MEHAVFHVYLPLLVPWSFAVRPQRGYRQPKADEEAATGLINYLQIQILHARALRPFQNKKGKKEILNKLLPQPVIYAPRATYIPSAAERIAQLKDTEPRRMTVMAT
ncbi:hypothetical protein CPB84DRAFT_1767594 [Gymnopilus junonius]|uniref:Uncharacterized protein n=1 Tax=Gymnopilus junonius TaxID=109634 RepID=A0A9P5TQY7_GYMJU|nr:hypothetical protein CPB84DRAFT_1767594 [Gymnopilus junonius]